MASLPSTHDFSMEGRKKWRRQRIHSTPILPICQTEITGKSFVCFADDQTWFQGTVNPDGESNYSIYGESMSIGIENDEKGPSTVSSWSLSSTPSLTPCESDEEDYNERERHQGQGRMESSSRGRLSTPKGSLDGDSEDENPHKISQYRMTVTDHFTGLVYNFSGIRVRHLPNLTNNESLLSSTDSRVRMHFKTENIYKGQKAAMAIQRALGSSSLLGMRCTVYMGIMHLQFPDDYLASNREWIL